MIRTLDRINTDEAVAKTPYFRCLKRPLGAGTLYDLRAGAKAANLARSCDWHASSGYVRHAAKDPKPMRFLCVETGERFRSAGAAARQFRVSDSAIWLSARRGKPIQRIGKRFIDLLATPSDPVAQEVRVVERSPSPVISTGIVSGPLKGNGRLIGRVHGDDETLRVFVTKEAPLAAAQSPEEVNLAADAGAKPRRLLGREIERAVDPHVISVVATRGP